MKRLKCGLCRCTARRDELYAKRFALKMDGLHVGYRGINNVYTEELKNSSASIKINATTAGQNDC